MTCQALLSRLDAAEARLALAAAADNRFGVAELWFDQEQRRNPEAIPDALYVDTGDPFSDTLLYDIRRNRFLTMPWANWYEDHSPH